MGKVREPNSVRFWRLNSIEALAIILNFGEPPADPEDAERRVARRVQFNSLKARERDVQARYQRMKAKSTQQDLWGAAPNPALAVRQPGEV